MVTPEALKPPSFMLVLLQKKTIVMVNKVEIFVLLMSIFFENSRVNSQWAIVNVKKVTNVS